MSITFPYVRKDGSFYPVVDIMLKGKKAEITVKALLDSGASFSVFRSEIADHLGVIVERGKPLYLEGIGGRILGYLHWISVAVGGRKFLCRIAFSREFSVSLNLIGRDNFFSKFRITFDEKHKQVVLE